MPAYNPSRTLSFIKLWAANHQAHISTARRRITAVIYSLRAVSNEPWPR